MTRSLSRHILAHKVLYLYAVCMAFFALLALVGALYVQFRREPLPKSLADAQIARKAGMAYIDLPPVSVSLAGAGMSIDLLLEVKDKDLKILQGYEPQIKDRLNLFFSHKTREDIGSPVRRDELRRELLIEINKTHAPVPVKDLYFQQIIMR